MNETTATARPAGDGRPGARISDGPGDGSAAQPTVELPRLGGYKDMQNFTGRSYITIAKWVCKKKLRPGIYVGNGLFNIYRIRELFDKNETFFLKHVK